MRNPHMSPAQADGERAPVSRYDTLDATTEAAWMKETQVRFGRMDAVAHAIRHAGFDQGSRSTVIFCPGSVRTDMVE